MWVFQPQSYPYKPTLQNTSGDVSLKVNASPKSQIMRVKQPIRLTIHDVCNLSIPTCTNKQKLPGFTKKPLLCIAIDVRIIGLFLEDNGTANKETTRGLWKEVTLHARMYRWKLGSMVSKCLITYLSKEV